METQRERELGIGIGFGMPFSLLQLLIAWQWHAVLKLVVLAPTSALHMHASPVFFFLWPGLACSAVCPAVAVAAPAAPPDPIHRHYSILLLSRACCITISIFSNHHIPSWADPTSCPSYQLPSSIRRLPFRNKYPAGYDDDIRGGTGNFFFTINNIQENASYSYRVLLLLSLVTLFLTWSELNKSNLINYG